MTSTSGRRTLRPAGRSRRLGASEIAAYCGSKPGTSATRPFGPEPLVFKVARKMFALLGRRGGQAAVSLKCDPDRALLLRASFAAITPGYHLNKEHWNTLALDGSLPAQLVEEQIDHSYELVARTLRRADRERLTSAASTRPPRRRPGGRKKSAR
ncbi:MAG TPA: MmcQ/YjbR family DNA-binding protein [Kofleriaceae bacterium]|nr:MmcQ/YjbR family DNA-binding protein [Kofleriaceae bacterium]